MKKVIATATLLSTVLSAPIVSQKDDHLERVQRLMASNPLIDGHNDLPWQFYKQLGNKIEDIDLTVSQPRFHTDIPRLRKGQVGGQFWSVYVPCLTNYTTWSDDVMKTLQQIDVTKRMIELYPNDFELAVTAEQVKTAFQRGKIASLMGMEGGHSIDSSLGTLRMMYELGARYMTLTHNCHTPWADSATVDPIHGGLTNFGERVIFEMNRLGMLIDISHVSADTMRQVLRITRSPIIFSHSSAFSLCNHPRNVPDDVLRLTATNGGLVMVNFYSQFVCCDTVCSLKEVADHIEYIYKLVGADFVGVGGDYDGVSSLPVGLEDVSKYPNLFAELSRRGISESDLVKIMGGNLIRVLEQNEKVAKELQGQTPPGEETIVQPRSCTPSSIAEDD